MVPALNEAKVLDNFEFLLFNPIESFLPWILVSEPTPFIVDFYAARLFGFFDLIGVPCTLVYIIDYGSDFITLSSILWALLVLFIPLTL